MDAMSHERRGVAGSWPCSYGSRLPRVDVVGESSSPSLSRWPSSKMQEQPRNYSTRPGQYTGISEIEIFVDEDSGVAEGKRERGKRIKVAGTL